MEILRGGRLVSFSPCIEQVQRTATMMRECGFVQVECIEVRREEKEEEGEGRDYIHCRSFLVNCW